MKKKKEKKERLKEDFKLQDCNWTFGSNHAEGVA